MRLPSGSKDLYIRHHAIGMSVLSEADCMDMRSDQRRRNASKALLYVEHTLPGDRAPHVAQVSRASLREALESMPEDTIYFRFFEVRDGERSYQKGRHYVDGRIMSAREIRAEFPGLRGVHMEMEENKETRRVRTSAGEFVQLDLNDVIERKELPSLRRS